MPLVTASNTLTIYDGTSSFTPLIGAHIAESFAGSCEGHRNHNIEAALNDVVRNGKHCNM
ncbi:hypothetical protein Lal_00046010 [Lupinus albus]|nr:hypothetical protein Lal_00046010 [Lupinus albus]